MTQWTPATVRCVTQLSTERLLHATAGPSLAALIRFFGEWDAELWTNQQHLMSRLARRNRVLFVESLGLQFNPHTTQIEPHDRIGEHAM